MILSWESKPRCAIGFAFAYADETVPSPAAADDLGCGDLSSYGATHFETPACDRLADEGMRFTDAHSPSAVCTPTRYSVLTGRYAWRSWLKSWVLMPNHPLLIDVDQPTVGKLFQQAGYRTACVGKWHLGWGTEIGTDFSGEVIPGVLETGFDEFFGVPYSHNSGPALQVYMRDRRIVGLPEGMNYREEEARGKTMRRLQDTAIQLSEEAVAFIDRHQDKPFFLYYPTTNIHFPITPNERFEGMTDFFATFADLLDQSLPKDAAEDSVSLVPVLKGETYEKPLRDATIHHSVSGQFAIRMGDWKLIEGSGDGDYPRGGDGKMDVTSWEIETDPKTGKPLRLDYFRFEPDDQHQLYNLKEDPREQKNLAAKHPGQVKKMLARLHSIRGDAGAVN